MEIKSRLIRIVIALSMLLTCVFTVTVNADEPKVTYGLEYGDDSVTVTLYITEIEAFDIAIAYDPSKLTVEKLGYTRDFKLLQTQNNMTISVSNEDAKDEAGNTYAIFTGAGSSLDTGEAIPFAGSPLATITFSGDIQNSSLRIITDSASTKDVYAVDAVADITLGATAEAVVTPEPIEGVTYTTVSEEERETADTSVESVTTADEQSTVAEENTDTASEAVVENSVEEKAEEKTEEVAKTDSPEVDEKDSDNNVILFVLIGIAIVAVAAVAIVYYTKTKKGKVN